MTKTIKQLYDEGQRQFPMRGGGVSPPLRYTPPKGTWRGQWAQGKFWVNYDGLHDAEWAVSDGCFDWNDDDSVASPFDLLPIPLNNYQVNAEEVKAAQTRIAEQDKRIAELEARKVELLSVLNEVIDHYQEVALKIAPQNIHNEVVSIFNKYRAIAKGKQDET